MKRTLQLLLLLGVNQLLSCREPDAKPPIRSAVEMPGAVPADTVRRHPVVDNCPTPIPLTKDEKRWQEFERTVMLSAAKAALAQNQNIFCCGSGALVALSITCSGSFKNYLNAFATTRG